MIFRSTWGRFVPVMLVMGLIFFLSNQNGASLPLPDIPNIDKVAHFLIYALLAAAALYAFPEPVRRRRAHFVGVLVILLCVLYGITDEFHQSFIPGRCVSGWDLLADTVGAVAMVLGWLYWRSSSFTWKKMRLG